MSAALAKIREGWRLVWGHSTMFSWPQQAEGHGPACGLHRGERCTCDALATRKAGAP